MATTTDPPTTEELEEARDRLRHEKIDRAFEGDPDGALFDAPSQLSFDLGTGRRASPDFATVKVSGSLSIARDLKYGQHVTVVITDQHGEVLCEGPATVGYPAFKDHFDKHTGKSVERIHTATVDSD